jgi:hypothetical protein
MQIKWTYEAAIEAARSIEEGKTRLDPLRETAAEHGLHARALSYTYLPEVDGRRPL